MTDLSQTQDLNPNPSLPAIFRLSTKGQTSDGTFAVTIGHLTFTNPQDLWNHLSQIHQSPDPNHQALRVSRIAQLSPTQIQRELAKEPSLFRQRQLKAHWEGKQLGRSSQRNQAKASSKAKGKPKPSTNIPGLPSGKLDLADLGL